MLVFFIFFQYTAPTERYHYVRTLSLPHSLPLPAAYRALHPGQTAGIRALGIGVRLNDAAWFETLPADLDAALVHKIYYGHFLCHVLHQDSIVAPGHDCLGIEHRRWALLDQRGARYPAEHKVGHHYPAAPARADF